MEHSTSEHIDLLGQRVADFPVPALISLSSIIEIHARPESLFPCAYAVEPLIGAD